MKVPLLDLKAQLIPLRTEIENAILYSKTVIDAAAILCCSEKYSVDEIVAFVETTNNCVSHEILGELKRHLPYCMLPSRILKVSKIPRTNRGKIDRKKLKEML